MKWVALALLAAATGLVVFIGTSSDRPPPESPRGVVQAPEVPVIDDGDRVPEITEAPVVAIVDTKPEPSRDANDPAVLEPLVIERRVRASLAVLHLFSASDRPLRDVRGVTVDPTGAILCRFRPLLGAYRAECRLEERGNRRFPVLGLSGYDEVRNLAIVRIDLGPEGSARADAVPILDDDPTELFAPEDALQVYTGQRLRTGTVERPSFATGLGYDGLLLASAPALVPESLLAIDSYGYLLGLCRPTLEGRLLEDGDVLSEAGRSASQLLVDPAFPLLDAAGLRATTSLESLTTSLYEGTFADLEVRGRRAFRDRRWAEAIRFLEQALARARFESIPQERLADVERVLRESYLAEIDRLRSGRRLSEAVATTESGLQRFSEDPALWLRLAELRQSLGLTRESLEALLQLRSLEAGKRADELLENAYLELGKSAIRRGEILQAEAAYLEGLGYLSDSGSLHLALGKLYFDVEAYDDAIRLLRRAKELDASLADQAALYLDKIDSALKRRDAVVIPIPKGSSVIRTKVVLDGRTEVNVIIDTGATYTALPESWIRALGYDPERRGEPLQVKTAAGPLIVRRLQIQSVSLQGYAVRNLHVIALPDEFIGSTGLLGLNFLNFFKYGVDSKRREFHLERQ